MLHYIPMARSLLTGNKVISLDAEDDREGSTRKRAKSKSKFEISLLGALCTSLMPLLHSLRAVRAGRSVTTQLRFLDGLDQK
jgi:hypothetical protein